MAPPARSSRLADAFGSLQCYRSQMWKQLIKRVVHYPAPGKATVRTSRWTPSYSAIRRRPTMQLDASRWPTGGWPIQPELRGRYAGRPSGRVPQHRTRRLNRSCATNPPPAQPRFVRRSVIGRELPSVRAFASARRPSRPEQHAAANVLRENQRAGNPGDPAVLMTDGVFLSLTVFVAGRVRT